MIMILIFLVLIILVFLGYYYGSLEGKKKQAKYDELILVYINKLNEVKQRANALEQKSRDLEEKEYSFQIVAEKEKVFSSRLSDFPVIADIISEIEIHRARIAKDYLLLRHAPKAAETIQLMERRIQSYSNEAAIYKNKNIVYERLFPKVISSINSLKLDVISPQLVSDIQEMSRLELLLSKEREQLKNDQLQLQQDKENYKIYRHKKYIEMGIKINRQLKERTVKWEQEHVILNNQLKEKCIKWNQAHAELLELYRRKKSKLLAEYQQKNIRLQRHIQDEYAALNDQLKEKATKWHQAHAELLELYQRKESKLLKEYQQRNITLQQYMQEVQWYSEILATKFSDLPALAKISADIEEARDLQLANYLRNKNHPSLKTADEIKKVLKEEKKQLILQLKEYQYRCLIYEDMFPYLTEYTDEPVAELIDHKKNEEYSKLDDPAKNWISKEEYDRLSSSEKYQLALDRYWNRKKSNAEIGRDYERYIGYKQELDGWSVTFYGIHKGFEDLGRDLICKKGDTVMIIQCKCWSAKKIIHEKHINQLFGTTVMYYLEYISPNNLSGFYQAIISKKLVPVFITSTVLSDTAKKFATPLGIEFQENIKLEKYPLIKCNINNATKEKIYHLPFDQQYDSIKISKGNEFYAMTIAEAEAAGFRHAKKHRYS